MTRTLSSALLAVAALLTIGDGATAAGSGGRVVFDDFENGVSALWSADAFRQKCTATTVSVDGRPTHSGRSMLECNWNGRVAWNDPAAFSTLKLNSWPYTREFLLRVWVRYASDVDRRPGGKLLRLYPSNGLDSYYLAGQMEQSNGSLFSHWELINGRTGPTFWGDASPLGDGNWHKLEIYMKLNTAGAADGAYKVWLDGQIKQQAANIVSAAPAGRWYPLHLMSNWSNNPGWEHDAANHVYWDDIEVYSDLGTGGTGLMSDATIRTGTAPSPSSRPSAPTNLRIVR